MRSKAKSRARRVIRWVCETWIELAYVQRRLIELQMDAPSLRIPAEGSELRELEQIYALPAREPEH